MLGGAIGGMQGGVNGGITGGTHGGMAIDPKSDFCKSSHDYIMHTSQEIFKKFNKDDVDHLVTDVEKIIKKCNIHPASYGWGKGTFQYWREKGQKAKLKKFEYDTNFKDLTKEIEQLPYKDKFPNEVATLIKKGKESTQKIQRTCTPVDLREHLPPVRDQDSIGWCYAFTAADLLSFKLKKNISAVDIALNYNKEYNKEEYNNTLSHKILELLEIVDEETFEGGQIDKSIKYLNANSGACLESNMRSDDNTYGELYSNILTLKNSLDENPNACENEVKSIFPNQDMNSLLKIAAETNKNSLLEELRHQNCLPRIPVEKFKIKSESDVEKFETAKKITPYLDTIDKQLSENNIIGIGYHAQILFQKNDHPDDSIKPTPHGSSVVGRRFNEKNGECEYLIRNAQGRSCDYYDFDCEEGNIWLPRSKLNMGLFGVTYLE